MVNPVMAEPQTQGAVVYGLTAALRGEIVIREGRAEQSNCHNCEMLRIVDMLRAETVFLPSDGFWDGVGEFSVAPGAPVLYNAIFLATGKRIGALSLKSQSLA